MYYVCTIPGSALHAAHAAIRVIYAMQTMQRHASSMLCRRYSYSRHPHRQANIDNKGSNQKRSPAEDFRNIYAGLLQKRILSKAVQENLILASCKKKDCCKNCHYSGYMLSNTCNINIITHLHNIHLHTSCALRSCSDLAADQAPTVTLRIH